MRQYKIIVKPTPLGHTPPWQWEVWDGIGNLLANGTALLQEGAREKAEREARDLHRIESTTVSYTYNPDTDTPGLARMREPMTPEQNRAFGEQLAAAASANAEPLPDTPSDKFPPEHWKV